MKGCRKGGETVFPKEEYTNWYPVPHGQPWEHTHETVYRLSRRSLGIHMYIHMPMPTTISEKRGYDWEREGGGTWEGWWEGRERGSDAIIISQMKEIIRKSTFGFACVSSATTKLWATYKTFWFIWGVKGGGRSERRKQREEGRAKNEAERGREGKNVGEGG